MRTARLKASGTDAIAARCAGARPAPCLSYQRGTVLIMSLVILLILTILGITALGTSTLQEKMSANIQESTRAFQVAESGLQESLQSAGTFNLNDASTTNTYTYGGGTAEVTTAYVQMSPPKRGSGYSSVDYDGANFNQTSNATGLAGSKATISRGVVQIVGKSK